MDKLATILNIDEKTITDELGEIKLGNNVYTLIEKYFKDDYPQFKRFYLFCNKSIPTVYYQFTQAYKRFEMKIVNNDIPFVSKEEEKEIIALINKSNSNVIDSLSAIKKMLIQLSEQNITIDTKDIVSAYDRETELLQSIFIDISKKLDNLDNKDTEQQNAIPNNSNKLEKYISLIKTNFKYIIALLFIILFSFWLGGVFL